MIKSNPYIYLYIPFKDLSNKKIIDNFIKEKQIGITELKKKIANLKSPQPKIQGRTVADKILSIFIDDNFRFGPVKFIKNEANKWKERFNYFIHRKIPLQFTILGFPFKIPVPLKTNRILPDLGELLALHRLKTIMELIKKIYPIGAKVTVFTESVFSRFIDLPLKEAREYKNYLKKLIKLFGYQDFIQIVDLKRLEKLIPHFEKECSRKIKILKDLYRKNEPELIKKYENVFPSIFRIIPSKNYKIKDLFDVYNEHLKDEEVSVKVRKIRKSLQNKAKKATFYYLAYLEIIRDFQLIEKNIPGALTLSVSPKPGRLGIFLIDKMNNKLPFHGVPVFYLKKNLFLIEYLIDIRRSPAQFIKVFFNQDRENKPLFYIRNN